MKLTFDYVSGGVHPIVGQVFHSVTHAEGTDAPRYQRYVATPLSFLAPDRENCAGVLALIDELETGARTVAEWEGHYTEAHMSDAHVQINLTLSDDWTDNPEGRFPLSEFKAAILAWDAFLHLPKALTTSIVVDLMSGAIEVREA